MGNGSSAGAAANRINLLTLAAVRTFVMQHYQVWRGAATGQAAKETPVQKTVPVIGTPADADPEQHEVLLSVILTSPLLSAIHSTGMLAPEASVWSASIQHLNHGIRLDTLTTSDAVCWGTAALTHFVSVHNRLLGCADG